MSDETLDIEAIKARADDWYEDWITVYAPGTIRPQCEPAHDDVYALLTALEAERADNERLRARVAALEAPREGILADAQALRFNAETLDKAEHEIEKMIASRKRTSRDALNELKVLMQERGDVIGGIAPAVNPAAGQDGD